MSVKNVELWTRWCGDRDMAAREALTEAYLWLVRFVAGRLMLGLPAHFEQDDVEGHGCLGLLEAMDHYDPTRGVRFETYAIPWIRGACLQGIRAQQWAPALRKRVRQLEQARADLVAVLGREPDAEELARVLKVSPAELERRTAEMGCLSILSLEEVLSDADGEGTSLHERLADPDAEDPLETSALEERRERLAAAIDSLPAQERLVVALIYHEGLTMREVTDLLELSAARISQIHSKAILRLRGKLARSKELMVS
jgi:RNA polymerase sigma factor for flagellar operon FliA